MRVIEELELKDFEGLSCLELHVVFNNKLNEVIRVLNSLNKESEESE